jgi:hypothetical protein
VTHFRIAQDDDRDEEQSDKPRIASKSVIRFHGIFSIENLTIIARISSSRKDPA